MTPSLRTSYVSLALLLVTSRVANALTDTWIDGTNGNYTTPADWTNPSNWSLGVVPNDSSYDAVFNNPLLPPFSNVQGPSVTLNSLMMNSANVSLDLQGAQIPTINIAAGRVNVESLLQNANISLQAASSSATFTESEVAASAPVRFDGNLAAGYSNLLTSDQALTIDAGASVRTGAGSGIISSGTIVNNGTISAETPGCAIGTSESYLLNNGLLSATAGTLFLPSGGTTNSGTVALGPNGTLEIPTLIPIGGTFSRNHGTVAFTGNLTGTGNTLDLANPFWGRVDLDRSTVANLTLTSSAGTIYIVHAANPAGDYNPTTMLMNVVLSTDLSVQPGGTLELEGSVAANNQTIHLNGGDSGNATLFNTAALAGNATISFEGNSSNNTIAQLSEIPAGVVVQTGSAGGTISYGSVLGLDGTISAQSPACTITTVSNNPINQPAVSIGSSGILQAINGGSVIVQTEITNSGSLVIGAGSSITCASTFTQYGSLSGNGTLNVAQMSGIWNIPLTVRITGTGLNFLSGFALAGSPDKWTGKLDIGAAGVVIYSITGNLSTISNQVAQAYANGTWSGIGGITSSALTPREGIALMTAPDYQAARHTTRFKDGFITILNSLVLTTALLGDTNLDNKVDITDLNTLLANFGQPSLSWTHGNFDYAPTIDLTDLADVLNNFGQTLTAPSLADTPNPSTPAPEPTSLLLLALATPVLLKRRSNNIL